ncbi:MAG TPA: CrcB family protein [Egibacteraceae bacterium]|nr:CrcB family protein [Egibacteraceae bacterium]
MTLAVMMAAGAIGALLRDEAVALIRRVSVHLGRESGLSPIAVVNLTGALAIGVLAGAGVRGVALVALGPGLLSGYTTYSTWMVESALVSRAKRWTNVTLQGCAGIALVVLGIALGRLL